MSCSRSLCVPVRISTIAASVSFLKEEDTLAEVSEVRYAQSGDIDIAYTELGNGPIDLVFIPGSVSHQELTWEIPSMRQLIEDLASFSRVLFFDKRGTGLSDRSLGFGSAADRMDDVRAVMDAAGFEKAAVFGVSEGGPLAILFAATYPDRVTKLALYGTFARLRWAPDYPIGDRASEEAERNLRSMREHWGTGHVLRFFLQDAPEEALPLLAKIERNSCTPHMVEEIMRKNVEIDVRSALPAINVPTLVAHARGDPVVAVPHGRYIAEHIPNACYVEVDADRHGSWSSIDLTENITEFLRGDIPAPEPVADRILATVLFTDIVSSTERSAAEGDQHWRDVLDHHDRIALREVERFGGRIVKNTGDGILATFDGPARGIKCGEALQRALAVLGLQIRAGVHTGEIELRGEDLSGIGVVIARRVCDLAADGEVLASRTVRDLVAGSGIGFADRGAYTLKGVPEEWRLYAVEA